MLNVQGKQMESSTKCKLETEIAKWVATACRPISIVQDVGLRNHTNRIHENPRSVLVLILMLIKVLQFDRFRMDQKYVINLRLIMINYDQNLINHD